MRNQNYKPGFGNQSKLNLFIILSLLILVILGCSRFGKKSNVDISVPSNTNSTNTVKIDPTPTKPTFTKSDASKAEMPSDAELQDITKTTLLNFNMAVSDADFNGFYSNIARAWQKQTTAEKLKTTFQVFIDKKINIGSISSRDASFSPPPVIEKELGYKTLKLMGRYSTSPNPTKFVLHYIPEGKDWKLTRIEIDTTP